VENFNIITNPEEFMKLHQIDDLYSPKVFEPIWKVHDIFIQETWIELTVEEFIAKIWQIMDEKWNWAFKPRSKKDKLYSDPWKWLDSLSVLLSWIKWMTREKYQRIIAYANKWYLDHFYVIHSGRFNKSTSN